MCIYLLMLLLMLTGLCLIIVYSAFFLFVTVFHTYMNIVITYVNSVINASLIYSFITTSVYLLIWPDLIITTGFCVLFLLLTHLGYMSLLIECSVSVYSWVLVTFSIICFANMCECNLQILSCHIM